VKTIVLGLTLSILFSSLPAKVWACGLNLCSMEHDQSDRSNKNQLMPCHSSSNEKLSSKPSVKKETELTKVTAEEICPCPDEYLNSFYMTDLRSQFDTSKTKPTQVVSYNLFIQGNDYLIIHKQLLSTAGPFRLHLIHQVFII